MYGAKIILPARYRAPYIDRHTSISPAFRADPASLSREFPKLNPYLIYACPTRIPKFPGLFRNQSRFPRLTWIYTWSQWASLNMYIQLSRSHPARPMNGATRGADSDAERRIRSADGPSEATKRIRPCRMTDASLRRYEMPFEEIQWSTIAAPSARWRTADSRDFRRVASNTRIDRSRNRNATTSAPMLHRCSILSIKLWSRVGAAFPDHSRDILRSEFARLTNAARADQSRRNETYLWTTLARRSLCRNL